MQSEKLNVGACIARPKKDHVRKLLSSKGFHKEHSVNISPFVAKLTIIFLNMLK
jgi:hypothetical protein